MLREKAFSKFALGAMNNLPCMFLRSFIGRLLDSLTLLDHVTAKRDLLLHIEPTRIEAKTGEYNSMFAVLAALSPDESRVAAAQAIVRELSAKNVKVIVISRVDVNYDGAAVVYLWTSISRDYFAFKAIWKSYLSNVRKGQPVLFLNDSIIWQQGAILALVNSVEDSNEVVIPTESLQVERHAQPYFFFVPSVATDQQIRTLLEPAREWRWKRTAVHHGEFVFLKNLIKSRLNFRFLVSHHEMHLITDTTCKRIWLLGCQYNPTKLLRQELAKRFGFTKVTS